MEAFWNATWASRTEPKCWIDVSTDAMAESFRKSSSDTSDTTCWSPRRVSVLADMVLDSKIFKREEGEFLLDTWIETVRKAAVAPGPKGLLSTPRE